MFGSEGWNFNSSFALADSKLNGLFIRCSWISCVATAPARMSGVDWSPLLPLLLLCSPAKVRETESFPGQKRRTQIFSRNSSSSSGPGVCRRQSTRGGGQRDAAAAACRQRLPRAGGHQEQDRHRPVRVLPEDHQGLLPQPRRCVGFLRLRLPAGAGLAPHASSAAPPAAAEPMCDRTWDGWLCWDDTKPGVVSEQHCPDYFQDFDPSGGTSAARHRSLCGHSCSHFRQTLRSKCWY